MPKDFATTGTESFNLQSQVNQKERIVLTIQEEKPADGVILDRETMRKVGTGNIFVDAFHKINRYLMSKGKVNVKDKATFFHLLSVMINAGIPVLKALKSLMMQMDKNPKLQMIIEKISDEIEGGSTLSESLVRCDDVFSEQEVGMIQSGEASGQLAKVLDNLAVDTEKTYHIKSKVKSAMMYPMVIFVLLIGVIVAMMVFVIPGLKDLFASAGSDLPLITRIVVGLSDFMINQKFVLVGVALFLIFGFLMFRKTALGKYMIDDFKIKVPIFGTLFKKTYLARISRSLSNLM
ncbi:MAG: type II secretion system F family protein, partial [Candidatus Peregrinibacteria bacterium]